MKTYSVGVWHEARRQDIQVNAGGEPPVLLSLLRENGLYMAAVCGGRGVCGKCAVRITENAPTPTPQDEKFFSPQAVADGYRLACLVRVTQAMELTLNSRQNEGAFQILNNYETQEQPAHDAYTLSEIAFTNAPESVAGRILAVAPKDGAYAMSRPLLRKCADMVNPRDGGMFQQNCVVLADEGRVVDILPPGHTAVYGIAIDIGTTTIVFALVDLLSGAVLRTHATINRQRALGADVISRIQQAVGGKQSALHRYVTTDISEGIHAVCATGKIPPECVYKVVITGNTTMLHLLLDMPCYSLGQYPFTPTFTEGVTLPYASVFEEHFLSCEITLMPGISAFVGADITAGILFCGGLNGDKPRLLIDLGTNGEMAVFSKRGVTATATAAGPAFEAGNITCGMGSVPGAIAKVGYQPESSAFTYETIGGEPAAGICGSGALDTVAALVAHGIVDETGLLDDAFFDDGVVIAPGIVFTQKDIRELQLAKSAVRSGIEVLLAASGLGYDDIEKVYLAGGFGHKINLDSAQTVGIFPEALRRKVVAVGNSALGGCVAMLTDQKARRDAAHIATAAREINLSADARFNNLFMENMMFV